MADRRDDKGAGEPLSVIGAGPAVDVARRFMSLSNELRGCAILGPDGLHAATGAAERWHEPARELLAAADRAAGREATHAHVATEDGEAYAVRQAGWVMVAVTDRFTLASLVLADMRASLRELQAASVAPVAEAA